MSYALSGITFANQRVTPSADGVLYGAVLSDGILSGVSVTYSAASLLVSAGYLLIGTRELRIPANLTIPVTEAVSGYARLKAVIDLTQSATAESFSQAYLDLEYSPTAGGFPPLTQEDLNSGGTRYEQTVCVMSLGAAGITGITGMLPGAGTAYFSAVVPHDASAWVEQGGLYAAVISVPGLKLTDTPDIGVDPDMEDLEAASQSIDDWELRKFGYVYAENSLALIFRGLPAADIPIRIRCIRR